MWNWDKLVSQVFSFLKLLLGNFKMSSFKLSFVVITRVFFLVALMSMQLIVTSAIEGAAHTNENLRKPRKSRFLVSNSMEGGSHRKLMVECSPNFLCMGGQTCCPNIRPGPPVNVCISGLGGYTGICAECNDPCPVGALCCSIPTQTEIFLCVSLIDNNNCGLCKDNCPIGQQCCSGQCVDILFNSANCGGCGHVCNTVCTLGFCGGYGSWWIPWSLDS